MPPEARDGAPQAILRIAIMQWRVRRDMVELVRPNELHAVEAPRTGLLMMTLR